MKTAQQHKRAFTFECDNCRQVVTEKLEPIVGRIVQEQGGHCDACCNYAEAYYASPFYQAFEEAEENMLY